MNIFCRYFSASIIALMFSNLYLWQEYEGNLQYIKGGGIDKLAEFGGAIAGGVDTRKQITKKILNVGVPKGANEEQIKMFQQAIEYGKTLNVEVQIKAVK